MLQLDSLEIYRRALVDALQAEAAHDRLIDALPRHPRVRARLAALACALALRLDPPAALGYAVSWTERTA
jgi:hypothetical protein